MIPRKALAVVAAALGAACTSFLDIEPASQPAAEVFLPARYDEEYGRRWPLILSLHGAGGLQPADNLIEVHARKSPGFPYVVLAPRSSGEWNVSQVDQLLAEAVRTYRVDTTRIYLTGLSMGARGAWNLARSRPTRFAGIVLIAGNADPAHACALSAIPVWLFHNRADNVVPVEFSQAVFDAHQGCGGDTRLTIYEELAAGRWAHNAWEEAWTSPDLYEWMAARHR